MGSAGVGLRYPGPAARGTQPASRTLGNGKPLKGQPRAGTRPGLPGL